MSLITRDGQANGHVMQGNEDYHAAVHYDMTAPVSQRDQEFIGAVLVALFPDKGWDIIGSYWDYSESGNKETRENPNGHYRVQIGEQDYVFCVNNRTDSDGWFLGNLVYGAFKQAGVRAKGNVLLPSGQWSYEKDGLHIHLEEYNGGATWLKDEKLNLDALGSKLGTLAGQVYNVAQRLPEEINAELEGYTDSAFFGHIRAGINFLNQSDFQDKIYAALGDVKGGSDIYESLRSRTEDVAAMIQNNKRLAQHGNMIEKMIAVDEAGELMLMGVDCAAYSYLPMVTENATYDAATAVYRILINPDFYDVAAEEKDAEILKTVNEFVADYNKETGLALTVQEALKAGEKAVAMLNMYEVGHYLANQDLTAEQTQEFKDHVRQVVMGVNERFERFNFLQKKSSGFTFPTLKR